MSKNSWGKRRTKDEQVRTRWSCQGVSKEMQPINMIIHFASSYLSSESWKAIISLFKGHTRWQGQKLTDFILQCTWKTKFFGTSSEGLFQTPSDRISHCVHIDRTPYCQLPTRSGIFCLLVEVIYWPCGLKCVHPTINLAFLVIIVRLNFLRNFACTVLNDFISK